jgi:IS30 family transposase
MAQLKPEEMFLIDKMDKIGLTGREIGRRMKKDHTVINRELKRCVNILGGYDLEDALRKRYKRRYGKRKPKLETNPKLKMHIIDKLKEGHSPEQISGRLKEFESRNIGSTISHELIYQFIYSVEGRQLRLHLYLRNKQSHRYKKGTRRKHKYTIPDRISIHDRPENIGLKKELGHWETDLMIFSKQRSCLSVQYEKKGQLCRIHVVPDKTAESNNEAIIKSIDTLPLTAFKTITYDNGTENVKHAILREQFGIDTYFCDAYKSWQKGGVENMNKLLREYLPRYINLEKLTEEDIYRIQEKLNNRPRKGLKYLTPNEYRQQFA